MATTAGVLEILITTKDETSSGLSTAESKVKKATGAMSSWAVAKGQLISNFVQKTGKAIINLGKDAVNAGMGFDKAMSQYMATRGATIEDLQDETSAYYKEMQEMTEFARKMGLQGKYSATQVAEALNYMALAGYDAETSMEMMPQVLALAAAGAMDLSRASDIVTDAQTAFGLSVDETQQMVDQMAKTASITNTSVEQLGEAYLTVGANARSIIHDGNTAELNAILGQLASNGIKGAKGGTVLRNILNALSNPAGKAAKQLKGIGVSAYDSEGNLKNMTEILADMSEALSGKTMEEQAEFFSKAFNVRDTAAVKALLDVSKDGWTDLMLQIIASQNAAEDMSEVQLDNLDGDVTKLKNAFEESKLTLVKGLTPSLRNLVQKGIGWVNRLTTAFKEKGLKGAVKEAWSVIKEAFTDGKNKIRIGIAGLLDLGEDASWTDIAKGISGKIKLKLNETKLKLADYFDLGDDASWADIGGKVVGKLTEHLKSGGEFIKALILGDNYKDGESTWKEVAEELGKKVEEAFADGGILNILLGNVADKAAAFASFAGDLITGIADWVGGHSDVIGDIITSIATALTKAAPAVIEALSGIFTSPELWSGLGKVFGAIMATIIEAIFGRDIANKARLSFGLDIKPEISKESAESLKKAYEDAAYEFEGKTLHGSNEFLQKMAQTMRDSGYSEEMISEAWDAAKEHIEDPEWINAFIDSLQKGEKETEIMLKPNTDAVDAAVKNMNYSTTLTMKPVIPGSNGKMPTAAEIQQWANSMDVAAPKAKGDWNVPYDNYSALLHRGEMVLTASQARRYRDGDTGGSSEIVGAIQSLKNDMANMKIVVGQRVFGRTVVDYGGRRLGNYIGEADSKLAAGYGT